MLTVSASAVSGLLGCFGTYRQYSALRKLTDAHLPPLGTTGSLHGEHVNFLEIGREWEQLHRSINTCQWQSEIVDISENGFKLLFWNKRMDNHIRSSNLQDEDLVQLLQDVIRCPQNHNKHMRRLRELKSRLPQDLFARLELSSMCYRYVHSSVCKRYGIQGETALIDAYNRVHDSPIVKVPHRFKKQIELPGGRHTIMLTGQIDGMQENVVIEIKHRSSKIFQTLPVYELVQLHVYMFLTGTKRCKMLQAVRVPQTSYVEQTLVRFSSTFWNRLLEGLAQAVDFLDNLDASEFTRACFCALPEASKFEMLQKYIPELQMTPGEYNYSVIQ